MNLFEQISLLRNNQSSSSSNSSSTQSNDDDDERPEFFSNPNNNSNQSSEEFGMNKDNDIGYDDEMQQSSFWKNGTCESWGPVLIEYKIQPNQIEKKLGMLQKSFVIPEYDPFTPNEVNKSKIMYQLPNVSQVEIEDIISQRDLFDE